MKTRIFFLGVFLFFSVFEIFAQKVDEYPKIILRESNELFQENDLVEILNGDTINTCISSYGSSYIEIGSSVDILIEENDTLSFADWQFSYEPYKYLLWEIKNPVPKSVKVYLDMDTFPPIFTYIPPDETINFEQELEFGLPVALNKEGEKVEVKTSAYDEFKQEGINLIYTRTWKADAICMNSVSTSQSITVSSTCNSKGRRPQIFFEDFRLFDLETSVIPPNVQYGGFPINSIDGDTLLINRCSITSLNEKLKTVYAIDACGDTITPSEFDIIDIQGLIINANGSSADYICEGSYARWKVKDKFGLETDIRINLAPSRAPESDRFNYSSNDFSEFSKLLIDRGVNEPELYNNFFNSSSETYTLDCDIEIPFELLDSLVIFRTCFNGTTAISKGRRPIRRLQNPALSSSRNRNDKCVIYEIIFDSPNQCELETYQTTFSVFLEIVDTIAPVFSYIPPDITLDLGEAVNFGIPVVTDECGKEVKLNFIDEVTMEGGNQLNTRTWTAEDECGNTAIATQNIILEACSEVNRTPQIFFTEGNRFSSRWLGGDNAINKLNGDTIIVSRCQIPFYIDDNVLNDVFAIDACGDTIPASDFEINLVEGIDLRPTGFNAPVGFFCKDNFARWKVTDRFGLTTDIIIHFTSPEGPFFFTSSFGFTKRTAGQIASNTDLDSFLTLINLDENEFDRIRIESDGDSLTLPIPCDVDIPLNLLDDLVFFQACSNATTAISKGRRPIRRLTNQSLSVSRSSNNDICTTYEIIFDGPNACEIDPRNFTIFLEVIDTIPPRFTSISEEVTIKASELDNLPEPTITECNSYTLDIKNDTVDILNLNQKILTRTWTATDDCGNTATASQKITILLKPNVPTFNPCDISIETGNNYIQLGPLAAANKIVKLYKINPFDGGLKLVDQCNLNCEERPIFNNLANGNYMVYIDLFDKSWKRICETELNVTVQAPIISACDDIIIEGGDTYIHIQNLDSPFLGISIIQLSGSTIFDCSEGCGGDTDIKIEDLAPDTYSVSIQYRDLPRKGFPEGQNLCSRSEVIQVGGANNPPPTTTTIACGPVNITYETGRIGIQADDNQYFYKIERRKPDWESIWNCTSACEKDIEFIDLPNGTYRVRIYNSDWTLVCKEAIEFELTGSAFTSTVSNWNKVLIPTDVPAVLDFKITPNPSKSDIYLDLQAFEGMPVNIRIIDAVGKEVFSRQIDSVTERQEQIILDHIARGLYYITVKTKDQSSNAKKLFLTK